MATTGDIKNNLHKLQSGLRQIQYSHEPDLKGMMLGKAGAFLPIYHHLFVEYSQPVTEYLVSNGFEMYGKTDLRFIECMYKVLRDVFSYKPPVSKDQFFATGFAERKVIMCIDVINLIRSKRNLLQPKPKAKRIQSSILLQRSVSSCTSTTSHVNEKQEIEKQEKQRQTARSKSATSANSLSHSTKEKTKPTTITGSHAQKNVESMPPLPVVENEITCLRKGTSKGVTQAQTNFKTPNSGKAKMAKVEVVNLPRAVAFEATSSSREIQAEPINIYALTPSGHHPSERAQLDKGDHKHRDCGYNSGANSPVTHVVCDKCTALQQEIEQLRQSQTSHYQQMENFVARLTILENRVALIQAEAAAPPAPKMTAIGQINESPSKEETPQKPSPIQALIACPVVDDNCEESFLACASASTNANNNSTPSKDENPEVSQYFNSAVEAQANRIEAMVLVTEDLLSGADGNTI